MEVDKPTCPRCGAQAEFVFEHDDPFWSTGLVVCDGCHYKLDFNALDKQLAIDSFALGKLRVAVKFGEITCPCTDELYATLEVNGSQVPTKLFGQYKHDDDPLSTSLSCLNVRFVANDVTLDTLERLNITVAEYDRICSELTGGNIHVCRRCE